MAISIPSGNIPSDAAHHDRRELTSGAALRHAWIWYITLLFIPFAVFVALVADLNSQGPGAHHWGLKNGWFLGAIGFMIVTLPLAFMIRSRMFRPYWQGRAVPPRSYLAGMLTLWITLEISGILSLAGCFVSQSLMPCLLPALAAFMFFVPLYPTGRAMSKPTGNTDDPAVYSEPR